MSDYSLRQNQTPIKNYEMQTRPIYAIRQGLAEEIDKSHIWVKPSLMEEIFERRASGARPRVKIKRGTRFIYAELLTIDKRVEESIEKRKTDRSSAANYCGKRDVLMNKWQRDLLDIKEWEDAKTPNGWQYRDSGWGRETEPGEIRITPCTGTISNLKASIWITANHPQTVVRCAYQLAKWSIILGVIGIAISVFSAGVSLAGPGDWGGFHWLLFAITLPFWILAVIFSWLLVFVLPICTVIRWSNKD